IEVPADQAPKFATAAAAPKPAEAGAAKAEPHAPAAAGEPAAAAASAKTAPTKPKPVERPKSADPAIAALIQAATIRRGAATIIKSTAAAPAVKELQKQSTDKLPPDARYAKVIEKSKPEKSDEPTRRQILGAGVAWGIMGLGVGGPSLMGFQRFMMPNVLE